MKLISITSIVVLASVVAQAQTLHVTKFNWSNAQGGVNIQAEFDQGPNPWCPAADVRWLQNVKIKDAAGNIRNNVPGYPNGDFTDPLPNGPGGPWDNDPWYDVTYNSAADRNTDTNRQGGKGRFFNDSPGGWGPFGPLYFCATTAIVCIDRNNFKANMMGVFSWGFCVSATGGITPIQPMALGNTAATSGLFNSGAGLAPWTVQPGDNDCQLTVTTVPEPASFAAFAVGVLLLRRKSRQHGRLS